MGYASLNPMQEAAMRAGYLQEHRVVVSAPTASGKTLLALMAIADNYEKTGSKAVYVVPLRALASEKHEQFKALLEPQGITVGLSTGELDSSSEQLHAFDVIVCTSEKMESLFRHNAPWLSDVGFAVIDEVHLLGDGHRGATLEVVLTKLIEKQARLLCLSATIPNADAIALWMGAKLVSSDYRPTPLEIGVCDGESLYFDWGCDGPASSEEALVRRALAENNGKGQALAFVATRRSTEALARTLGSFVQSTLTPEEKQSCAELADAALKALSQPTSQCRALAECLRNGVAFHHAGLVGKQRSLIERGFKKERCLKCIACTTTLAMGIDYPASWVIVRDLKRFNGAFAEFIPALEAAQMCLPASAELLLADGTYRKIKDIIDARDNCSLVCVNESTGKLTKGTPTKWFKREAREFVSLRLSDGRELTLTPNHPLFGLDACSERKGWNEAGRLRVGDFVGVLKRTPSRISEPVMLDYFQDAYVLDAVKLVRQLMAETGLTYKCAAEKLEVPFKTLKSYAYNKAIPLPLLRKLAKMARMEGELPALVRKIKTKQGNPIFVFKRLPPRLLWFIGLAASDGSLTNYVGKGKWLGVNYRKIKLDSAHKGITRELESFLKQHGVPYYKTAGKGEFGKRELNRIEISNQLLADLLSTFGVHPGKKAYDVAPSKAVFELPSEHIAQYVAGVFDGDGNLNEERHAIRLCVKSKFLTFGVQRLLKKLGIRSTVSSDKSSNWWLGISSLSEVNKFKRLIPCVRITPKERAYQRMTHPKKEYGDLVFEKVVSFERVTTRKPQTVYNLSVASEENYVYNDVLVHNCGRAGRPVFDSKGTAVLCCKPQEKRAIVDKYVTGRLEDIWSQLSSKPMLRGHCLGLIASRHCGDFESLYSFFNKTFYASQYSDREEILEIVTEVVRELIEMGFVREGKKLLATPVGKRVSELYIDPLTAHSLVKFAIAKPKEPFDYLLALNSATEARPLLRVNRSEENGLWEEMHALYESELEKEEALEKYKSAKFLNAWVNESTEGELMEEFQLPPGVVHSRVRNMEWLAYALQELCFLLNRTREYAEAKKIRKRIKQGVKEELLDLCSIRGVGRVRARRMWKAGVQTKEDYSRLQKDDKKAILYAKGI